MGDTFHDPVDHARTTRPHAGRALINVAGWPGYALLAASVMIFMGSLVAFGTGHDGQGAEIVAIAVISALVGTAWLLMEHRRIGRVHQHWHLTHSHQHSGT